MSMMDSAVSFIEGIKSAMDVSAATRGTLSGAVSDGLNDAFHRIKAPLEQSLMKILFMFVSVFFVIWGIALFLEDFLPYNGLGYVIVGALFGLVVLVFLQEKSRID